MLIKTPTLHASLAMTSARSIGCRQGSVPSRQALTFSLSASVPYAGFCCCVTKLTMCHVCVNAQKVSGMKSWLMFTPSFCSLLYLCIGSLGKRNNNELKLPEVPFCCIFICSFQEDSLSRAMNLKFFGITKYPNLSRLVFWTALSLSRPQEGYTGSRVLDELAVHCRALYECLWVWHLA